MNNNACSSYLISAQRSVRHYSTVWGRKSSKLQRDSGFFLPLRLLSSLVSFFLFISLRRTFMHSWGIISKLHERPNFVRTKLKARQIMQEKSEREHCMDHCLASHHLMMRRIEDKMMLIIIKASSFLSSSSSREENPYNITESLGESSKASHIQAMFLWCDQTESDR